MDALTAGSRRRFLGTAAGIGAAAVVAGRHRSLDGRSGGGRPPSVSGSAFPGRPQPLPPVPAGVSLDVAGVSPFITPNDDFYRIDTALIVPAVDVGDLEDRGEGNGRSTAVSITYDQLLARPMIEADVTISCVSNEVGGDLVGNARWLGCRLDDLLAEAGIDPGPTRSSAARSTGSPPGSRPSMLDGRDAHRRRGR